MSTLHFNTQRLFELAGQISEPAALIKFDWLAENCKFDSYVTLSEGIEIRKLAGHSDIRFEHEVSALKHLQKMPGDCQFFLVKCKAGAFFGMHYHYKPETMLCVWGHLIETKRNITAKDGDTVFSNSFQHHAVKFIEDSFVIVAAHPNQKMI